jgi:glyoxylase-like metal-dependent hydrolase (beta-lactamase superfamily II)
MGPDGHPNFPHAQYFLRKEDWDFWTSETTLADPAHYWMAEFIEKKLKPVQAELHLLEQDREIVPGIQTLFTPGHTPGNLSFIIQSGEEQLMYLGDVFLHPIHIEHPTWTSEVDILPRKNGQARRKLLEWAACEQALVFATHFDFPSLGHILRRDKKYLWRPIKRAW